MPSYKNGTFKVDIPVIRNPPKDLNFVESKEMDMEYKSITVNPLSQNELADGWTQVVPKANYKMNISNRYGKQVLHKKHLYNYFKIDLAKLPENLWNRLEPVYEENIYSYSIAKYNRYVYIVNPTVVDEEIRELKSLLDNTTNVNTTRILELLQVLQDNDIYGWLVIKAKNTIGHDIQEL